MNKKSLAGTNREYVEVQLRQRGKEVHVQAKGHKGNRTYGFSGNIGDNGLFAALPKVIEEVEAIMRFNVDGELPGSNVEPSVRFADSMAGTEKRYVIGQAAPYGDGEVHIQLASDDEINREYGAAFTVKYPAFEEWLRAELE